MKRLKRDPTKSQREHYATSRDRLAERLRVFVEIQQSGNPLTVEDMRRLIARFPVRYGFMQGLVDRADREARETEKKC